VRKRTCKHWSTSWRLLA